VELNRTPNELDRNARNGENDNWDKIEGAVGQIKNVVDDFVGEVSDEAFNRIIDDAKLHWKEPVDSFGDLPSNAEIGDTRMVKEADPDGLSYVYRYDGKDWVKIQTIDATLINEVDARISEEIIELDSIKLNSSIASKNYYVSPFGNDENDGSEESPFRTLSRLVSTLPDTIRKDHVYTLNIMSGDFGKEDLRIENKVIYGELIVQGTTPIRESHKVNRVHCISLLGNTVIRNITTTSKNNSAQSFLFKRCSPFVEVYNVRSEGDPEVEKTTEGVIGLLADQGSRVHVMNSDFSGKRYGIRSNYLSYVTSRYNTGIDNNFGVGARWGGIATLYDSQPKGDVKDITTSSGGIISYGHGGKLGLSSDERGLIQEEMENDGVPKFKKYNLYSKDFNLAGQDIPQNKRLRLRFIGSIASFLSCKVSYGARTNLTGSQTCAVVFTGILNVSAFTNAKKTVIVEHLLSSDNINLTHRGSNVEFDITVDPLQALSDNWGIDIEFQTYRNISAPHLMDLIYEDR